MRPANTIIIYGPQGCGKSRYAKELANHYGKNLIVDAFLAGQTAPDDALVLTSDPWLENMAIPFDEAMAAAFIKPVELTVPLLCGNFELNIYRQGRHVHAAVYIKRVSHGIPKLQRIAFAMAQIDDAYLNFSDRAPAAFVWLGRTVFDISVASGRLIAFTLGFPIHSDKKEGA